MSWTGTRRDAVRLLGGGACMAVIAACQPTSPAGPTSGPAIMAAPSGQAPATPPVRTGGAIRAGSQLDVSSLDGHTLQAQDYNTKWAV